MIKKYHKVTINSNLFISCLLAVLPQMTWKSVKHTKIKVNYEGCFLQDHLGLLFLSVCILSLS